MVGAMRIHLELLGVGGLVLEDETFESPLVTVGPDAERDDFFVADLATRLQISVAGTQLEVRPSNAPARTIAASTTFVIGATSVRVTPYPGLADTSRQGDCPRCKVPVRDVAIGAGYRSMARRERGCAVCGGAILDLAATDSVIGAFADASVHDWVHVAVSLRCPGCRAAMTRATFSTDRGAVQVERCVPCGLVFLGPDDRDRLRGPI